MIRLKCTNIYFKKRLHNLLTTDLWDLEFQEKTIMLGTQMWLVEIGHLIYSELGKKLQHVLALFISLGFINTNWQKWWNKYAQNRISFLNLMGRGKDENR